MRTTLPALPEPVCLVLARLEGGGFPAYLVGGSVRDALLERIPADYDVATSATPAEVQRLFPEARPTGLAYGTVTVPVPGLPGGGIEVTTFRSDGQYLDGRRPEAVCFGRDLGEDLRRRDFTINALAWHPVQGLVDPFGGREDLVQRRLRTVGEPEERFREDALRMLRACRLCAELRLRPAKEVLGALRKLAALLGAVSVERRQAELAKLLVSADPQRGLRLLRVAGLLPALLPELEEGRGMSQSSAHAYTVYTHTLKTVAASPPDLVLRLAALFHDLGKPKARAEETDGGPLFPDHARLSAGLAATALRRLGFPRALSERVVFLVAEHMFHWTPQDGPVALRRMLSRMGPENLAALVALRRADLLSLRPLVPGDHRLEVLARLEQAVDEVLNACPPVRRVDLAVTGQDLMETFRLTPGPEVGRLLTLLLDNVLEDPLNNRRDKLMELAASHLDVAD